MIQLGARKKNKNIKNNLYKNYFRHLTLLLPNIFGLLLSLRKHIKASSWVLNAKKPKPLDFPSGAPGDGKCSRITRHSFG